MQTTAKPELDNLFDGNDMFKNPSNASNFGLETGLEQRYAGNSTSAAKAAPIFNRPVVTQPRAELALEDLATGTPAPVAKAASQRQSTPQASVMAAGPIISQPAFPTHEEQPTAPSAEKSAVEESVSPKVQTAKPKKAKKPGTPMNRTKLVRALTMGAMLIGGAYVTLQSDTLSGLDESAITQRIRQMISPELAPVQQAAPARPAAPVEPKEDVSVTQLTDSTPTAMPSVTREDHEPVEPVPAPPAQATPAVLGTAPELKAPLANATISAPVAKTEVVPAPASASTPPATVTPAAAINKTAQVLEPKPAATAVPVAQAPVAPATQPAKPAITAETPVPAPAQAAKVVPTPVKPASAPTPAKPVIAPVKPAPVASTLPPPKPTAALPIVTAPQAKPADTAGRMTVVREGKPGQVASDDDIIYPISTK